MMERSTRNLSSDRYHSWLCHIRAIRIAVACSDLIFSRDLMIRERGGNMYGK